MKYEVFFKMGDCLTSDFFHGSSPGEAFASCLLKHPEVTLIKCKKGGEEIGDAVCEWAAPAVQRKPEPIAEQSYHRVPKYKQEKDPMPAMRDWYEKHRPQDEPEP